MAKKEASLQEAISTYIMLQFPSAIFTSESSGIKLTMGQAVKLKKLRSGKSLPDMLIFEPRGSWHGLMIEVKSESPYLKTGELKQDIHIQEQFALQCRLVHKGYNCEFVWTLEQAKKIIDNYMALHT